MRDWRLFCLLRPAVICLACLILTYLDRGYHTPPLAVLNVGPVVSNGANIALVGLYSGNE